MDFLGGSDGKEPACNVGDLRSIPGMRRSPGGGRGNPLQYSCLKNPHGQKSLGSYSPWGCKELDATKHTMILYALLCFAFYFSFIMLPTRDHIYFFTPEIYFMTSVLILWLGLLAIVLTPKHSFTFIAFLWLSESVNLLGMAAYTFY